MCPCTTSFDQLHGSVGTACKQSSKYYHKTDIIREGEFIKVLTGQQPNKHSLIDQSLQDYVVRNCQKLKSLFFYVEERTSTLITIMTFLLT